MSFYGQIRKFELEVESAYERSIEKIAHTLFDRIRSNTPVDTGAARANWNISKDTPDLSITDNVTLTRIDIPPANSGDNLYWIANALHYIYELENGKSGQAPSGMVMISLEEVTLWVNSVRGKLI